MEVSLIFFSLVLLVSCQSNVTRIDKKVIKDYTKEKQLRAEYQIDSAGLRDGYSKEYFTNGKLQRYYNYSYGKLRGFQNVYFENGSLKMKSFFDDKGLDSLQEYYYPNGSIKAQYFRLEG